MTKTLSDSFGRTHNYLRISLTDKCNFRCTYCMPSEQMKFMPDDRLMSASEIIQLATIFKSFGISKIRLTGGEPTLRKDLEEIVTGLSSLKVELSITSNALLLHQYFDLFKRNNLNKINISIDTFNEKKFEALTRRDTLKKVVENIEKAIFNGFEVKLNTVLIRDSNDDEVIELVERAAQYGVSLRFIEYMPFFKNDWEYKKVVSKNEILNIISSKYDVNEVVSGLNSTSRNYEVKEIGARFGIIPTVTQAFCNSCNRVRLTADGKIKNCLFSNDENDLLSVLRNGGDIESLIRDNILRKKAVAAGKINFEHENAKIDYSNNRSMVAIGG